MRALLRALRRSPTATRLVALGYQCITGKPIPVTVWFGIRDAPPRPVATRPPRSLVEIED